MARDEYATAEYQRARRELLENKPLCHWCHDKPATEADHIVPVQFGGSWRDGLVPSCKSCNASRGAKQINKATRQRLNIRDSVSGANSGGKRSAASAPAKADHRPARTTDSSTKRGAKNQRTKNENQNAFFSGETLTDRKSVV